MRLLGVMELAGFFTAHAVWRASARQGPVVPLLATEKDGERSLTRFDKERSMEKAVQRGTALLAANENAAERGILLYDAYVTIGRDRSDALMVHGLEYGADILQIEIIQPYRPANSSQGFAVMQPKVSFPEAQVAHAEQLIEAFFRGLDSHEEGGPLWSSSLIAA